MAKRANLTLPPGPAPANVKDDSNGTSLPARWKIVLTVKRVLTVRSLGNYRARVNCLNRADSCGNSGNFARGEEKGEK